MTNTTTQAKRGRPPAAKSNPYLAGTFDQPHQLEALQAATTVLQACAARRSMSPVLPQNVSLRLRKAEAWASSIIDDVLGDNVGLSAEPLAQPRTTS